MLTGSFRIWVNAEVDVLWGVLLDSVENPQRYGTRIQSCRVLERQDGEVVKELQLGHESAPGVFDFFVFNRGVLREIKSDESTPEYVTGVFRCINFDNVILREVTVQEVQYQEKILISNEDREIRRELVTHPTSTGNITIRVVPVSVQNPMAPIDLQFQPALVPTAAAEPRWQQETLLAIREEQQALKAAAEKGGMRISPPPRG